MSIRDLLRKWSRFRDQETVELAEHGIAPEDEVRAMEERVAEHRHEHDEPPPEEPGT
jgi:hypothetical protein